MKEILESYYNDGLLMKQHHPTLPLTIWNYTNRVQYDGNWGEVTMMCRGLVTDDVTGKIVARPFKKFFNLEERRHIPTKDFDVYSKEDGSLIIAFQYRGEWVIASRGSFASPQAIAAKKLFYDLDYHTILDNPTCTFLFEYCSDWNRIVVKYEGERLILLGIVETNTGNELDVSVLSDDLFQKEVGYVDVVKKHNGIHDYSVLKKMVRDNEEGFVVRFSNGDRIKIKGDEYLRLHKIMTNVSTTSVWELLSSGVGIDELLQGVPDEFYSKIKDFENFLMLSFKNIKEVYRMQFNVMDKTDRKIFALVANETQYPSILFAMLDNKPVDPIIWKLIKPKHEKL